MAEQRRKIAKNIQVSFDLATAGAILDYQDTENLPSASEAVRTLVQIALSSDASDGKMRAALRRGFNEVRIRSINRLMTFWSDYARDLRDQLASIEYDAQLCPKCGERCANCVKKAQEAAVKALAEGGGDT
jgi:hypothetical protein